jgi:hypothetical protein
MNDKQKIVALVGLGLVALYLLKNMRDAQLRARPIGFNPLDPQTPSFTGANVGTGTNPLTSLLSSIGKVFSDLTAKGPGNAPAMGSTPSTTGAPSMPWTLGQSGSYIPPPPLNPNGGQTGSLPHIGDPNLAPWDYIAYQGAPSLAWTLPSGFDAVPAPPGAAGGGLPDLSWTMSPDALGFDPDYIPPPPAPSGRISIVGLET